MCVQFVTAERSFLLSLLLLLLLHFLHQHTMHLLLLLLVERVPTLFRPLRLNPPPVCH
jgi:hypothetical protein